MCGSRKKDRTRNFRLPAIMALLTSFPSGTSVILESRKSSETNPSFSGWITASVSPHPPDTPVSKKLSSSVPILLSVHLSLLYFLITANAARPIHSPDHLVCAQEQFSSSVVFAKVCGQYAWV